MRESLKKQDLQSSSS